MTSKFQFIDLNKLLAILNDLLGDFIIKRYAEKYNYEYELKKHMNLNERRFSNGSSKKN